MDQCSRFGRGVGITRLHRPVTSNQTRPRVSDNIRNDIIIASARTQHAVSQSSSVPSTRLPPFWTNVFGPLATRHCDLGGTGFMAWPHHANIQTRHPPRVGQCADERKSVSVPQAVCQSFCGYTRKVFSDFRSRSNQCRTLFQTRRFDANHN